MSEEARLDDGETGGGTEVPGETDPLADLVGWTNEVLALQRASAVFPSLEAVIDDNGYFGSSTQLSGPHLCSCWLLCGSQEYSVEVFRYLDEHCVELNLIPELFKSKALVYIHYHQFG
jgi:hypothetical protein